MPPKRVFLQEPEFESPNNGIIKEHGMNDSPLKALPNYNPSDDELAVFWKQAFASMDKIVEIEAEKINGSTL